MSDGITEVDSSSLSFSILRSLTEPISWLETMCIAGVRCGRMQIEPDVVSKHGSIRATGSIEKRTCRSICAYLRMCMECMEGEA